MDLERIDTSKMLNTFIQEIRDIQWFKHNEEAENKYYLINSIFEAYDTWNAQMLMTWEPQIMLLEQVAIKELGDERIDKIFEVISFEVGEIIWEQWEAFLVAFGLEDEVGLDNEMLDMVKRDICWACIERLVHIDGFFSRLLNIYRDGYFPCSWIGIYPDGKAVVL